MLKNVILGAREKYRSLPDQMRASFWFLICAFLQRGISVITTPIFTRLLSTSEYGQFSVFNSWMGIITVLVTLNLSAGVYTQGLVKFDDKRNVYTSSLQGLTLVLVATWTVIYLLFRDFWNSIFTLTTVQMLAMLVIIWGAAVFNFWSMEQRVDFKYRHVVLITLIVSVVRPGLGIVLVLHAKDKVTARILGMALMDFVAYIGLFIKQMRQGKTFYSARFWKYAVLFNLPLVPHYLSMNVLNSADRIMISNLVGDAQAGIYSLAYSVSQIMTVFNTALLQTIEPWIYKKIKARQIGDLSGVAYSTFILIAVVNLLLIAFAPEVVAVFAPPSYYEAIYVIPPVAMSVYFMYLYTFFATFEFYYEKTGYITLATTTGAGLNILLNWLLIPRFGYLAAGYTTLACYIVFAVFHYVFGQRLCEQNMDGRRAYSTKRMLQISCGFIAAGFVLLATYRCTPARYALLVAMIIGLVIKRKTIVALAKRLTGMRKQGKDDGSDRSGAGDVE